MENRYAISRFSLCLAALLIVAGCDNIEERERLAREARERMNHSALDMHILDQNMALPAMQDANTRWDSVSREDDLFYYDFTVVNLGSASFSPELFDQQVAPSIIEQTCRDDARRSIIDTGYTVVYRYRDENANDLAEVSVSSVQCTGY